MNVCVCVCNFNFKVSLTSLVATTWETKPNQHSWIFYRWPQHRVSSAPQPLVLNQSLKCLDVNGRRFWMRVNVDILISSPPKISDRVKRSQGPCTLLVFRTHPSHCSCFPTSDSEDTFRFLSRSRGREC